MALPYLMDTRGSGLSDAICPEVEVTTPEFPNNKPVDLRCPECSADTKLLIKTNRHNGNQFLGCPNWPDCDYTREIPESMKMALRGYKRLL